MASTKCQQARQPQSEKLMAAAARPLACTPLSSAFNHRTARSAGQLGAQGPRPVAHGGCGVPSRWWRHADNHMRIRSCTIAPGPQIRRPGEQGSKRRNRLERILPLHFTAPDAHPPLCCFAIQLCGLGTIRAVFHGDSMQRSL